VLIFIGVSLLLCLLGFVITYIFQGSDIASRFIIAWIFDFNGLFVGGTGYGLLLFVKRKGRNIFNDIINTIKLSGASDNYWVSTINTYFNWLRVTTYSIPVTLIGGFILWKCGYPLQGFAKYYLAICSISIYFVATFILIYFLNLIRLFMHLEANSDTIEYTGNSSPMIMESINTFLIITATLGLIAIYFGFRGTLTAGFAFKEPIFKKALILPIVIYLPATLIYSFYPRLVLKHISDKRIILKIEKLNQLNDTIMNDPRNSIKEKVEFQRSIADLKEKIYSETKRFPVLGLKDSPSLLLSLLIIIQFIMGRDQTISSFFDLF